MSYLVIARKYRPQRFDEIIGQEHISRTLKNAIKLDKIHHAYLFTGPRGTGKTTTARLLAKAVNCGDKKDQEPCNKCDSCKEITASSSVDIIEIDAASNRGIDEIRQLRENVKFAPASCKYKVYIIDEVHMLTKEAFNAILKTLEEPPPHAIFIMATTEPEKVLETISSRCQTFNFKLIPEKDIKEALEKIAKQEKAECDEEGLWMITRAARGSMRDAQSIMDQVLSFSGGKITAGEVRAVLGLIPREFMFEYTEYIKNGDTKGALSLTEKILKEGFSANRLFNELTSHFRNMMFAKVFGESAGLGFNMDYAKKLADSVNDFTKERLVWMTEFMTMNAQRIKYADNPHIVLDTVVFKLCSRFVSFEEVLNAAGGQIPQTPAKKNEEPAVKKSEPAAEKTGKAAEEPKAAAEEEPEEEAAAEAADAVVEEDKKEPEAEEPKQAAAAEQQAPKRKPSKGGKWEIILTEIRKDSQPLYHMLKESEVALIGRRIHIKCRSMLDLNERHRKILDEKIKEVMGEEFFPAVEKINPAERKEEKKAPEKPKTGSVSPAKIEQDEPIVGKIVDMFEGRVEK